MAGLVQDVKHGFRQLRHSPALALVAITTLALGIGVTTAIFGVIDSWLLKPLPVPHPDQITVMTAEQPGSLLTFFSLPEFRDYKRHSGPFADVFGYALNVVGLSQHRRADHILVSYVTGNYFSSLGLKPYLGRLILPSEGQAPGASPVVVLSYDYWKSRFNGDRGIIGQSVRVDGQPVTVVGVTPPDFKGTFPFLDMKAFLPISIMGRNGGASSAIWTNRSMRMLYLMGRLKPGATVAQARAAMNVEAARLAQQYPDSERGFTIYVYPQRLARPPQPHQYMRQGLIAALFLVLGGLVLLVACFNVASMLIARALGRTREMALRVALGAGRGQLLRQTLAETLVLALIGGGVGLLLGQWLVSLLGLIHMRGTLSLQLNVGFDWRVYAFAFLACLVTGVVVGIAPALRASRSNPNEALREGGARLSGGVRSSRLRRGLVVTQLAGSLVLLIVAGLFVRSLSKAESIDLGYDPHGVLDVSMNPGDVGYSRAQTIEFYKNLLDRVRATPGVESAALAIGAPLSGYMGGGANVYVEGRVLGPNQHPPQIFFNSISPGYFRTMRIALLRGRTFTKADDAKAPPVAVINQSMASQLWPGKNPLGQRFRTAAKGPWITVVGVTADVSYLSIILHNQAYFYRPMAQSYSQLRTLQIRSTMAPDTLALEIQKQIHSLEPQLPVFDVGPLSDVIEGPNGLLIFRLGAAVAGGLGLLGLVLAVVGLYGVVSYMVNQRRHEIAIRMAVGAAERDILLDVLRDGGWMVGIGWVIGVLLALVAARAASRILMGVGFLDPLTYIAASLALGLVALLACYLPARRAMRVDPATALRYE